MRLETSRIGYADVSTLGAALLDGVYAWGWAKRVEGARVVAFNAPGLSAFSKAFDLLAVA